MQKPKRISRRLQPAAYAILNDYFINVSEWPDVAAQDDLAEKVRRVPGCEFYTSRQVYSYFANNRTKIRTVGKDAALPTGHTTKRGRPRKVSRSANLGPGPSATLSDSAPDTVTNKLDVLLDEDPDPSPDVVEVWAQSLGNGVVPEHIMTYAFLRRGTVSQSSWHENEQPLPANPDLRPEGSAPAQSPLQSVEPSTSLDTSANASPPADSPREEPEEHPGSSTTGPSSPLPTNNAQVDEDSAAFPTSQPSSVPVPAGDDNAMPAPTPALATITVGPDDLVEHVRAALLKVNTRGMRDSPKTFVDFARWLKAHNEDRGAVLHTRSPRALRSA